MTTPVPRPELLLLATLYLLAKYAAVDDDPARANAALHHLRCLASHPGIDAMLRETCAQLASKLESRGGHDERADPCPTCRQSGCIEGTRRDGHDFYQ